KFPFTRLLSDVPLVMGTLLVMIATIRACDLRVRASPFQDIAPSCIAWVLALRQPYFLRSPAHHRPDVSLSWALPQGLCFFGHPPPQQHPVGTYSGLREPLRGYSVPHLHCSNP